MLPDVISDIKLNYTKPLIVEILTGMAQDAGLIHMRSINEAIGIKL